MAGGVNARDNLNILTLCVSNDIRHLALCQIFVGTIRALPVGSGITVAQCSGKVIGITGGGCDRHIIQGKAEALIVRQIQLDLIETGLSCIVDDRLDACRAEILSVRVHVDDIIAIGCIIRRLRLSRLHSLGRLLCGRFLRRRRENDERCEHRRDQQQREERFAQFSHQYFLLFLG